RLAVIASTFGGPWRRAFAGSGASDAIETRRTLRPDVTRREDLGGADWGPRVADFVAMPTPSGVRAGLRSRSWLGGGGRREAASRPLELAQPYASKSSSEDAGRRGAHGSRALLGSRDLQAQGRVAFPFSCDVVGGRPVGRVTRASDHRSRHDTKRSGQEP